MKKGKIMITTTDARESLEAIESVADDTQYHLWGKIAGWQLIIWGAIVLLGYLATYALVARQLFQLIWGVWIALGIVGWGANLVMMKKSPVKSPNDKRWGMFWFVFSVYQGIWLWLMWPWNGAQLNLFLITSIMFAYIVMGIWFSRTMIILGVLCTLAVIIGKLGFYQSPLLWLWLGVAIGGSMIGFGTAVLARKRQFA